MPTAEIFDEATFENVLIELFHNLGYEHKYGPDIVRDYYTPYYAEQLSASLRIINKQLPETAIDEAINKIKSVFTGVESLKKRNEVFMDYIQGGIEVSYFDKGEDHHSLVYLIDYKNVEKNTFQAVNQWTYIEKSEKRADIVVFINGLPIVILELKSPSREETNASEAYNQLRNYMCEIPGLFVSNAFCVMSDMSISKAGTITAKEDRFMEWKTKDGSIESRQFADYDTFFEGIFTKERLLDIISNFICFSKEEDGDAKILAAYHQYFAVKK